MSKSERNLNLSFVVDSFKNKLVYVMYTCEIVGVFVCVTRIREYVEELKVFYADNKKFDTMDTKKCLRSSKHINTRNATLKMYIPKYTHLQ